MGTDRRRGALMRKWWWFVIPLAIVLAWFGGRLLDLALGSRLQELGSKVAGHGYVFHIDHVRSHLFEGSIDVIGITLEYDTSKLRELGSGDVKEILNISTDLLKLQQVSYWDLLTDGDVKFHLIEIDRPLIEYFFKPVPEEVAENVVEKEEITELPSLIRVDTLRIRSAHGSTNDISGTRPSFNIGGLDLTAYDLDLRSWRNGAVSYYVGGANVHAWDLSAELPPIYDLHIADLQVLHPLGSTVVQGVSLDPRYNEHEYGAKVEQETDLFEIELDTLQFHGIDVRRFMIEQELHMRRMEVNSPRAKVYRDKTIHDGKFIYKHLPVSGVRKIGISLRIDTIAISNGEVEYHEKDKLGPEYGMVSFTSINGLLTGLNNSKDADTTSHLIAKATALVYDRTPVEMTYKASMASTRDAFTIDARLGALPFSVFNRMTDDLLNVKATQGKIHSLRLHMNGNEQQATGTLDLAYEDLKIDLVPAADQWHEGKLKNLFGNALVRSKNLPGEKNYRQGVFTVERRKNRAIFNFLWQGVKAGSVNTMAPGLIRGPVSEAVSRPSKKNDIQKDRKLKGKKRQGRSK